MKASEDLINVVIADPCFLIREGLKKVFEADCEIRLTAEIVKPDTFIDAIKMYKPDVLIVDYYIPSFIDINELNNVSLVSPGTNILVISDDSRKETIVKTIRNGVIGYLTKECGADEILKAIRAISIGEKFFCHKILDILLEQHVYTDCEPAQLSQREFEIIKLATDGLSSKEIADKLFLSIHTVYTHRKNIMKKLKLKSSVELVLYAINSGLTRQSFTT